MALLVTRTNRNTYSYNGQVNTANKLESTSSNAFLEDFPGKPFPSGCGGMLVSVCCDPTRLWISDLTCMCISEWK